MATKNKSNDAPMTGREFDKARAAIGTGAFIVATANFSGELHVLGEYTSKRAAEWHRADLQRFEAWQGAKVYARAELRVVYFTAEVQS